MLVVSSIVNPCVLPAKVLRKVEHPLPGLSRTGSISPLRTMPSRSWRIWIFVDGRRRTVVKIRLGSASVYDMTVSWKGSDVIVP